MRRRSPPVSSGWIGVDLDGTLVEYHGWVGPDHLGKPIPLMVERVRGWLADGKDVRIFTARVAPERELPTEVRIARMAIIKLCVELFGQPLVITCKKDLDMIELWDDRCRQVVANTGKLVGCDQCSI